MPSWPTRRGGEKEVPNPITSTILIVYRFTLQINFQGYKIHNLRRSYMELMIYSWMSKTHALHAAYYTRVNNGLRSWQCPNTCRVYCKHSRRFSLVLFCTWFSPRSNAAAVGNIITHLRKDEPWRAKLYGGIKSQLVLNFRDRVTVALVKKFQRVAATTEPLVLMSSTTLKCCCSLGELGETVCPPWTSRILSALLRRLWSVWAALMNAKCSSSVCHPQI